MMFPCRGRSASGEDTHRGPAPACANQPARRPRESNRHEVLVMKWETPQAIDLRFGMEITMYIANR